MNKKFLIFAIFIFSFNTFSQNYNFKSHRKSNYTNGLQISIPKNDSFYHLNKVQPKLKTSDEINIATLESISKQLETSTLNLFLLGVLLIVSTIFMGIYVSFIEKKMARLNNELSEMKKLAFENRDINFAVDNMVSIPRSENEILNLTKCN